MKNLRTQEEWSAFVTEMTKHPLEFQIRFIWWLHKKDPESAVIAAWAFAKQALNYLGPDSMACTTNAIVASLTIDVGRAYVDEMMMKDLAELEDAIESANDNFLRPSMRALALERSALANALTSCIAAGLAVPGESETKSRLSRSFHLKDVPLFALKARRDMESMKMGTKDVNVYVLEPHGYYSIDEHEDIELSESELKELHRIADAVSWDRKMPMSEVTLRDKVFAIQSALCCMNIDEDSPRDLIADIMHYCSAKGYDFETELRVARDNYAEETTTEEEE